MSHKVRASNRADDDGNDEEDEAIEEDEVETPWSRGRKAGTTGIKRRATRASGLPSEGDELADFQDALQVLLTQFVSLFMLFIHNSKAQLALFLLFLPQFEPSQIH